MKFINFAKFVWIVGISFLMQSCDKKEKELQQILNCSDARVFFRDHPVTDALQFVNVGKPWYPSFSGSCYVTDSNGDIVEFEDDNGNTTSVLNVPTTGPGEAYEINITWLSVGAIYNLFHTINGSEGGVCTGSWLLLNLQFTGDWADDRSADIPATGSQGFTVIHQ